MGKPVIIDSDDVETLLYAAGALKPVEHALYNAKTDFQYEMAKPKLSGAVDRVNHLWLKALAEEPVEIKPSVLTEDERDVLDKMFEFGPVYVLSASSVIEQRMLRRFRDLRLIEGGTVWHGFRWPSGFDINEVRGEQAYRLTTTGRKFLAVGGKYDA